MTFDISLKNTRSLPLSARIPIGAEWAASASYAAANDAASFVLV
jgi:hypothetical protein